MTKSHWKLLINEQEITLTIICQQGICTKCQQAKELRLISEKKLASDGVPAWEIKKFCWSCSLNNLYQLEESDYQLANKKEVINELRTELNNYE